MEGRTRTNRRWRMRDCERLYGASRISRTLHGKVGRLELVQLSCCMTEAHFFYTERFYISSTSRVVSFRAYASRVNSVELETSTTSMDSHAKAGGSHGSQKERPITKPPLLLLRFAQWGMLSVEGRPLALRSLTPSTNYPPQSENSCTVRRSGFLPTPSGVMASP